MNLSLHLHLVLDSLAEDVRMNGLSPLVGSVFSTLSLTLRESSPPAGEKMPAITWAGAAMSLGDTAEYIEHAADRRAPAGDSRRFVLDDVAETLRRCQAFAGDRHAKDALRAGRGVSPEEVDRDASVVRRAIRELAAGMSAFAAEPESEG